ncbi:MAG: extracellular solute-binding protein [Spirochaetaceae bacterium]|jgi:ABC-type glycerol-3-phosphate transport system substrate-binding protein|nr:extracellular solute-binding protein [Spirochaetaceae bacterium]
MRKSIILMVTLCSICGSFVWAKGDQQAASDAGTLNVYVHMTQLILGDELKDASGNTYRDPNTAWLKFAAERFTAQTGIKVNFVGYSSDGAVVKSLLQVGDKGLDIFSTGFTFTNEEYAKYTAPVISVTEAKAKYDAELVSAMQTVNGNVHDLQIAKGYGEAITYNENVIKKAGYNEIPGTLEEFNKLLAAIKASGVTPIALHRIENWPLSTLNPFSNYVAGEPDAFAKMLREAKPFSDTAPVGKTLKMYTTWKSLGYFEQEIYPDFGVAMDSVSYGKAGMMLFGSWVLPQVISRVPTGTSTDLIKFDAAPDFGKGRWILVIPNLGWAINKASVKQDQARQFIEFLAKDTEFIVKAGSIPTHKDAPVGAPKDFALIDSRVRSGQVKQMVSPPLTQNNIDNDEVLKDANLLADYKWAGLPFDALDITRPNDWTAYNAQIERQNADYERYRKQYGFSYK